MDFRSVSRMSEVVGYYMVTIKGIVRKYTVSRLIFLLEIIEVIDIVHCVWVWREITYDKSMLHHSLN